MEGGWGDREGGLECTGLQGIGESVQGALYTGVIQLPYFILGFSAVL